jgi:hypothetical protein
MRMRMREGEVINTQKNVDEVIHIQKNECEVTK